MKFSEYYKKARSGTIFFVILIAYITFWIGFIHLYLGLDPDFGELNLSLSIEASVSVAMLLASQEKQDNLMRLLVEKTLDTVEDIEHDVEIIEKELEHG